MAAPKARKTEPPRPAAPPKELRPWQLAVFIVLGLLIALFFLGFGFAKKSHDEYGQWPWARTAVPPKMYYDHRNYAAGGPGSVAGLVRVAKSPGGGVIWAASADKKTPPAVIDVQKQPNGPVRSYTLVPKP